MDADMAQCERSNIKCYASVFSNILIYGPPRRAKRKRFWVKIEEMVKAFSGPWAVFGDFNSTKESGEKKKEDPMSLRVQ